MSQRPENKKQPPVTRSTTWTSSMLFAESWDEHRVCRLVSCLWAQRPAEPVVTQTRRCSSADLSILRSAKALPISCDWQQAAAQKFAVLLSTGRVYWVIWITAAGCLLSQSLQSNWDQQNVGRTSRTKQLSWSTFTEVPKSYRFIMEMIWSLNPG